LDVEDTEPRRIPRQKHKETAMFHKPGDNQFYGGQPYVTNEVGGIDIATVEPTEPCPKCNAVCHAEFCDNGFGPFAVQVGPYHCEDCGWIEQNSCWIDPWN